MKRLIFGLTGLILLLFLFVYIGTTFSNAEKELISYQRQAPFSEHEMTYHNIGSPWFGKGIVFYHPEFPTIPFKLSADRLGLVVSPNERIIRLSGVKLDISKTLQNRATLLSDLRFFQMPQDLISHPFEGLAILGFDTLKGDIHINILEIGSICYLTFNFNHTQQKIFELKTSFLLPQNNGLWDWTSSKFQEGQLKILSPNWLQKLSDYYVGIDFIPPHELTRAISQKEPWIIDFYLDTPISFSALFGEK